MRVQFYLTLMLAFSVCESRSSAGDKTGNPGERLGNPGERLGNPGERLGNPGERIGNPGVVDANPGLKKETHIIPVVDLDAAIRKDFQERVRFVIEDLGNEVINRKSDWQEKSKISLEETLRLLRASANFPLEIVGRELFDEDHIETFILCDVAQKKFLLNRYFWQSVLTESKDFYMFDLNIQKSVLHGILTGAGIKDLRRQPNERTGIFDAGFRQLSDHVKLFPASTHRRPRCLKGDELAKELEFAVALGAYTESFPPSRVTVNRFYEKNWPEGLSRLKKARDRQADNYTIMRDYYLIDEETYNDRLAFMAMGPAFENANNPISAEKKLEVQKFFKRIRCKNE